MTDLVILIGSILACLALAQLNIVLFGIVKRALADKAILGDKEIIVLDSAGELSDDDSEAEETEAATEAAIVGEAVVEGASVGIDEETEDTETEPDSEQIADLAAKVAALATEVSALAAKAEEKK